ncbi:hypothetical protein [Cetobacterium sp. 2A]|nr:hypothetical protein [Cetobacterium sp. 2A]
MEKEDFKNLEKILTEWEIDLEKETKELNEQINDFSKISYS